jgi:ubiquinone/menaquinone biosynthesis C-methylase UbiE
LEGDGPTDHRGLLPDSVISKTDVILNVDGEKGIRTRMQAWDREYRGKGVLWRGVPDLEFDLDKDDRVLEVGCGNGKTLAVLAQRDVDVVGLDFSRGGLELCRRSGHPRTELVQGNVLELPFAAESFDAILCYHVLEHLYKEEREIAASELVRVLDKGGKLHVQAFSVEDMRCGDGTMVEPMTFVRGQGIPYHYFTETELVQLFARLKPVASERKTMNKRYYGKATKRDRLLVTFQK